MQRNEGIFASWIKIISYAAEVYASNSEGSGMFLYVGDDPQSILKPLPVKSISIFGSSTHPVIQQ